MINKFMCSVISAVLVVAAMFFSFYLQTNTAVAGAGNGVDSKVETLEDLNSVLEFVSLRQNETADTSASYSTKKFFSDAETEAETEAADETVHTSVTWVEETEFSMKVDNSFVSFSRTLTSYMTQTASVYVSKGCFSYDSDDISGCLCFDLSVYINASNAFVKLDKYKTYSEGETSIKSIDANEEMRGQWVQLPADEALEILEGVDEYNRDALSMLQGWIEDAISGDGSGFTKNGNVYTLDSASGYQVGIDLSDSKKPYISMQVSSGSTSLYLYDITTFSNIDNTVVSDNITPAYEVSGSDDLFRTSKSTK